MFTRVCPALALFLGMLASSVHAATYYVNGTQGSASNSCTVASQGAGCTGGTCSRVSLRDGSACLSPGDTLIVKGGTYTNQCLGDYTTPDFSVLPSGVSAAAPTTVRNAPGETVTMRNTQQCNPGINGVGPITFDSQSTQHVLVDGINMNGVNSGFQTIQLVSPRIHFKHMILEHAREAIGGEPNENTFEDITVRHSGYNESFADTCPVPELGCHGIYFYAGNNNRFTRIIAHGNTGLGITITCDGCDVQPTGSVIEQSTVYDNRSYGILVRPGNVVKNSVIYHNYTGVASSPDLYNNTIVDNTNTNMSGQAEPYGIYTESGSGQVIKNNIVLGHGVGRDIVVPSTGPTLSHNICGALDVAHGCTVVSTPVANFVNPGGRDYHLKAGAPAINAGVTVSEVLNDYDGQARSAGQYDIGADELTTGVPPVPTSLTFSTQPPSSLVTGSAFTVAVRILDQFGVPLASTYTVTLALGANPGGATLSGTKVVSTGGTSTATFSGLSLNNAGVNYTLVATATPTGLGTATSAAFTVTAPVPVYLSYFDDPPLTTPAGAEITPPIHVGIFDASGNVVTTSTAPVTLSLQQNPAGGTLDCGPLTCIRNAVNGEVFFTGLRLTTVGAGYTFRANSPGLQGGESGFFAITTAPSSGTPAPPDTLRLLADTVATEGTVRLGWNYMANATPATGFLVERQAACTGAFTARPQMPMPLTLETGVNLATATHGGTLPGVHGTDYIWPDATYVAGYTGQEYFAGKGLTLIRLPFQWERIQRTLGGALDSAEVSRLQTTVGHLRTLGLKVVLNLHNEGRYFMGGTNHLINGGSGVTEAHLADVWSRLATLYQADLGVEFDLMNEPHTMTTENAVSFQNAALVAIRATGAQNRVHVEGNGFSHPSGWNATWYGTANAVAMLTIVDPLTPDNLVFQVHEYFDTDTSECLSATIGSEYLAPFTAWLRANNKKGFLGEFGTIDTPTCHLVIQDVLRHVRANSDVWMGWNWWVGGPPSWWGGYPLLLEPLAGPVDTAYMNTMEPFLAEEATVAQTYTDTALSVGNTYCWRVKAVDMTGQQSAPSNVLAWPTEIPPPTGLTVTTFSTGFFVK